MSTEPTAERDRITNMRSVSDVFPTRKPVRRVYDWPAYPSEVGFVDDGIVDDVAVSRAFHGDKAAFDRLNQQERCALAARMLEWWEAGRITPAFAGRTVVEPCVNDWGKALDIDPYGLQVALIKWRDQGLPVPRTGVLTYLRPLGPRKTARVYRMDPSYRERQNASRRVRRQRAA